jgi:RND family efflux transporter MFP subunit
MSPKLEAGAFFKKGDVLAEMDPRDYELAVTRARARVAANELRQKLTLAEAEVAREEWKDLGVGGTASALLRREPQLAESEAGIAGAQADLEKAELDLPRTRVRAPFDGVVAERFIDEGQFTMRGGRVARILGAKSMEVRMPISTAELAFLEDGEGAGSMVVFEADYAGVQRSWTGAVERTESEIDARSRMIRLIAAVPDPYGLKGESEAPLKPGMFVRARISGRVAEDVVVLPRIALRSDERVFVVTADARLEFRNVTVERATRDVVVIVEGLKAGERVCVSPLDVPVDGMRVRLVEFAAPANNVDGGAK